MDRFSDPKGYLPGGFGVYRCGGCGLKYTWPQPDPAVIGQYYDEDYGSWHIKKDDRDGLKSLVRRITLNRYFGYAAQRGEVSGLKGMLAGLASFFYAVNVNVPDGARRGKLLDIGCGSGDFLHEMKSLGWDVRGVEPSPAACLLAEKRWGIKPLCGEVKDVEERGFDLVSLRGVIEHLYNPLETLGEIRGLLNPGGRVFITTHNIEGSGPRFYGTRWVGWEVPQHLYFFDRRTLPLLLEKAGFRPVYLKNCFRTVDLFNTLHPSRMEQGLSVLLWRLAMAFEVHGGLAAEAAKE